MSSSTESKSLTQEVKRSLLGWLREGKYPPGSRLPSVQELVAQLNVSRTVVREALHSLAGMNLIQMRPGMGCFVNQLSSDIVFNADVFSSLLGMDAIVEVVAARRLIEGGVAREVALSATEEDFEDIEEALRQIKRAVHRDRPMYSATPEFHVAVARATHNKVLEKVVLSFNLLMAAGGALIERHNPDRKYRVDEYESHRMLFEVIRSGDPDRAQRAMEEHIGQTLTALLEISSRPLAGDAGLSVHPDGRLEESPIDGPYTSLRNETLL